MDLLYAEEAEQMAAKQEEVWAREAAARQRLMAEVATSWRQVIQYTERSQNTYCTTEAAAAQQWWHQKISGVKGAGTRYRDQISDLFSLILVFFFFFEAYMVSFKI